MREMLSHSVGRRRQYPDKGQNHASHMSYKRFKRWIIHMNSREGPTVSTPLATERQREPNYELDAVCRRLEMLDSPPSRHEPAQGGSQGNLGDTAADGDMSRCGAAIPPKMSPRSRPATGKAPQQGWTWKAAFQGDEHEQQSGANERRGGLQTFAFLDTAPVSLQGRSVKKLAAPSLLDDYYTNVLDCSCRGTVALALGSSVCLWDSETQTLLGNLEQSPQPGGGHRQAVSCLSWSRDGGALCIGTRRGEVQLWDVENKRMRCLTSHLSVVGGLSWKQQLLSSGSVLGRIHHLDPRAPAPLVGAAEQSEGLCSLQWSPGDRRLASGSPDGLLHIWDGETSGPAKSKRPVATVKQPSAVKAMGWCPWQENIIATGGGWKDGELRIWDTQSGTCVTSVHTNSQICSLRWAAKKRYLVTGHGSPHHQVISWTWESPSLNPVYKFTGHSGRVLGLALTPAGTQVFSAGVDQCFHTWDL